MKLTVAAILVSRGMKVLQAAPAAYPYRSPNSFSPPTPLTPRISECAIPHTAIILAEFRLQEPTAGRVSGRMRFFGMVNLKV